MSDFFQHTVQLTLETRRCAGCHRYYASEYSTGWRCGHCWHETAEKRATEIDQLQRSNRALRGALKRKGK